MQSQKMQFWEVREAVRSSLKVEGITGLWKGYFPTLYRDVPFSALYWPLYECFKRYFLEEPKLQYHPLGAAFVAGASAGGIARLVIRVI